MTTGSKVKSQSPLSKSVSPQTHIYAGATSGLCSCIVGQPLDLLKTRIQQTQRGLQSSTAPRLSLINTVRQVVHQDSILGLWRGTLPTVLRTVPGSAAYFFTLNELRTRVATRRLGADTKPSSSSVNENSTLPKLTSGENLITGGTARALVGFIFMPITILKVRYESNLFDYNKGLWNATRSIWMTDGLRGFFYGYGATALRDAPYAGIYVLFYEQAKASLHVALQGTSTPLLNSIAGAFAATAATLSTHPFDLVKTRMQLRPKEYPNTFAALKRIAVQEGFIGLFDGVSLRVARKALTSAVAWTVYEQILTWSKDL